MGFCDEIYVCIPDLTTVTVLGRALSLMVEPGMVITLSGPLGAGKTAVARALIQAALGHAEEVPSPTFSMVQTYNTPSGVTIWHFDLYRITIPEDILELGIEEAFASGISLVEWPDRLIGTLCPVDRLDITLLPTNLCEERQARLQGNGIWVVRLDQLKQSITGR